MVASTAEPLRTIKSVARETGIPYLTLRRLIRERRVPSVSVAGLPPRLRLTDIRATIEERAARD
jgi:hypothetical protein